MPMQPMLLHWAPRLWGPRASGGPAPLGALRRMVCLGRLFIFLDTLCDWEFGRNAI